MKWIALSIDCVYGKFEPVGPFETEDEADQWIVEHARDPRLCEVFELRDPTDPPKEGE